MNPPSAPSNSSWSITVASGWDASASSIRLLHRADVGTVVDQDQRRWSPGGRARTCRARRGDHVVGADEPLVAVDAVHPQLAAARLGEHRVDDVADLPALGLRGVLEDEHPLVGQVRRPRPTPSRARTPGRPWAGRSRRSCSPCRRTARRRTRIADTASTPSTPATTSLTSGLKPWRVGGRGDHVEVGLHRGAEHVGERGLQRRREDRHRRHQGEPDHQRHGRGGGAVAGCASRSAEPGRPAGRTA